MKFPGLKIIIALFLALVLGVTATGCSSNKGHERDAAQAAAKQAGESQEIKNLKLKREREEDPNKTRYLYVFAGHVPIGYYVTVGKISSNSSQIGPELELADNHYRDASVLDSAKDDGSYGDGDPGIFFFLADGTMVETTLKYIQSDTPIPVDVPQLFK
jgi:hypothetical protein